MGGRSNAGAQHILSLCDRSGNAVRPWARKGAIGWCVDLEVDPHVEVVGKGAIVYCRADVHEWQPPVEEFAFGFAWPSCTDLAYSGARWFDEKGWERYGEALALAGRCRDLLESHADEWLIENPASRLKDFFGDADEKFDPFQFDDLTARDERYTKETWLWVSDGFRMPAPQGCDREEADDRIHKMAPGEQRAEKRSETPVGFSRAVFLAQRHPGRFAIRDGKQTSLQEATA